MSKELDAAILRYRNNPTDENHTRLLEAQAAHTRTFHQRLASEYITRTTTKPIDTTNERRTS